MANFPDLTLESPFPFGKYKGRPVSQVLVDDTGYLLWLRGERLKTATSVAVAITDGNGDEHVVQYDKNLGMSVEIHYLLDDFIRDDPALRKKYKLRFPEGRPVHIADSPVVEPAVAPEGWGSW